MVIDNDEMLDIFLTQKAIKPITLKSLEKSVAMLQQGQIGLWSTHLALLKVDFVKLNH